jgi:hypothetical protein
MARNVYINHYDVFGRQLFNNYNEKPMVGNQIYLFMHFPTMSCNGQVATYD